MRLIMMGMVIAVAAAACGASGTASSPISPAALAPSSTPAVSTSPPPQQSTATPDPADESLSSPIPTMPPFPGTPLLALASGDVVDPSAVGGCRTVYYLVDVDVGDQCGPFGFEAVLASKPIPISTGEAMMFVAPPTYVFSVADTSLEKGWSVTIAPATALKGVDDAQPDGIPDTVAQVLASGLGPDATVTVRAQKTGDYVLQLGSPMSRDGWTFVGSFYCWLIRVG
jgi:hypothetical protein